MYGGQRITCRSQFSVHRLGPGHQTQVVESGSKYLHLQNHCTCPSSPLFLKENLGFVVTLHSTLFLVKGSLQWLWHSLVRGEVKHIQHIQQHVPHYLSVYTLWRPEISHFSTLLCHTECTVNVRNKAQSLSAPLPRHHSVALSFFPLWVQTSHMPAKWPKPLSYNPDSFL